MSRLLYQLSYTAEGRHSIPAGAWGPWERGWLRRLDSNQRPSGYEPDELPLLHAAGAL